MPLICVIIDFQFCVRKSSVQIWIPASPGPIRWHVENFKAGTLSFALHSTFSTYSPWPLDQYALRSLTSVLVFLVKMCPNYCNLSLFYLSLVGATHLPGEPYYNFVQHGMTTCSTITAKFSFLQLSTSTPASSWSPNTWTIGLMAAYRIALQFYGDILVTQYSGGYPLLQLPVTTR